MANPPFAGDIKETRILAKYEVARTVSLEKINAVTENDKNIEDISKRTPTFPEFLNVSHETIYKMADGTYRKVKVKSQSATGRDILFIERNLSFLKPGGRMAVVLPQGRFNNSSDKPIREFIAGHGRILAVVGLHGNVFKPHTGTKTSVLFVQKWDDVLCPKVDDYPIFFATMQESSKDNSGDKIYVAQADGSPLLDAHEHLIVKHDLFNHDGITQDGIAEAFIEFAKKENLSFFDCGLSGSKNLTGLYAKAFDSFKYSALLEQLEISEVKLSELEYSGRLDSEYYRPIFLRYEKVVKTKRSVPLSELSNFLIGPFGSAFTVENYTDDKSYRYIRGKDVKQMKIMDDDNVYLPKVHFDRLSKYALRENDVLVSVVGTLGNAALIQKENIPAIFSCKNTVLRVKGICASYLLTYINSKYGRSLLLRKERGAIQKGLNLDDLKTLEIFVAGKELQLLVEQVFKRSIEIEKKAKLTHTQAENLLLNALGMADFSPSTENINAKSFKDSFVATGRLDAEHYQTKYEQVEEKIKAYPNGFATLGEISPNPTNGVEIREYCENGTPYLRIGDIKQLQINEK